MGIPVSPPVTSEDSEGDSESPGSLPPVNIPITKSDPTIFNPQLIRIDERTMQLHFTPLYFGESIEIIFHFSC